MLPQGFTQKYTIIQLFEELEDGYEYPSNSWPLHSTIVDTFAINWMVDEMTERLAELLKNHDIATSTAGDDEFFGANKEVQVVLLERTDSLAKLHNDIVDLLEEGGLTLNDPQYARNGFLPHSTAQKHARLQKGDKLQFTALSIVDMFPNEDPYMRKVLKTIKIGAGR